MDGDLHGFTFLDGRPRQRLRVHAPGGTNLDGNALVLVVGFKHPLESDMDACESSDWPPVLPSPDATPTTPGLLVRSEADGSHYYCENRSGNLEVCRVDVPSEMTVATPSTTGRDPFMRYSIPRFNAPASRVIRCGLSKFVAPPTVTPRATRRDPSMRYRIPTFDASGSSRFVVSPTVLNEYSDFRLLISLVILNTQGVVTLLGTQRVAKELGEEFVSRIAGDGIPLLSKQHLRDVHNDLGGNPTLKMPTDQELQDRVKEAITCMPLRDRDAGLVLFGKMQEIVSAFVENIESEARRDGNVGVRPYQTDSNLIRSCLVEASGMDATFAIFDGFRKDKVNIAVSPGCTAVYFPGLSLTVALPEGHEVQTRRVVVRPACPFSQEVQESLPILLGLAPKLAKKPLLIL